MTDSAAVLEQSDPKAKRPEYQPRRKRINKGLAGALAASTDQTWDEIAAQVGAANGNSLKTNMFRLGVTKEKVKPGTIHPVSATITAKLATEVADIVKDRLQGSLLSQAEKIAAKPVGKLANKGQGEAAVLETLSRTWRNLNGNPDSITFQFGASRLSDAREIPQAVVDCVPVQDPTEQPNPQPVEPSPNT